jgi:hypothetical protein
MAPKTGNREKVIAASRNTYGSPYLAVEQRINKWIETKFDKGMALAQEYKDKNPVTNLDEKGNL